MRIMPRNASDGKAIKLQHYCRNTMAHLEDKHSSSFMVQSHNHEKTIIDD